LARWEEGAKWEELTHLVNMVGRRGKVDGVSDWLAWWEEGARREELLADLTHLVDMMRGPGGRSYWQT